ncbi:MAG: hypothetical protein JJT75_01570 [Opitutales bacterium]|nr:hypothetical protein [Opitutales bacterium]MCH8540020.1 hypothetical protein [Opitutales bacterium]
MSEIRIVIGLFLLVFIFFALKAIDPRWLLFAVMGLLWIINLVMTVISVIQAWRRDPRFLSGFGLGIIQVGVGLALIFGITAAIGRRVSLAEWVGFPFVAGGLIVLMVSAIGFLKSRKA